MKDYYEILGINTTSNSGEIKKAYRKLSMNNHGCSMDDPSMDYAQINHGLSMDNPWMIHRLSVDIPWIIHG